MACGDVRVASLPCVFAPGEPACPLLGCSDDDLARAVAAYGVFELDPNGGRPSYDLTAETWTTHLELEQGYVFALQTIDGRAYAVVSLAGQFD